MTNVPATIGGSGPHRTIGTTRLTTGPVPPDQYPRISTPDQYPGPVHRTSTPDRCRGPIVTVDAIGIVSGFHCRLPDNHHQYGGRY